MFYGKITERNINHAIIDWCNISYAIGFHNILRTYHLFLQCIEEYRWFFLTSEHNKMSKVKIRKRTRMFLSCFLYIIFACD